MEPQMDMQQLFAAAQQMQEQVMNAQAALADAEVTGTAGGRDPAEPRAGAPPPALRFPAARSGRRHRRRPRP